MANNPNNINDPYVHDVIDVDDRDEGFAAARDLGRNVLARIEGNDPIVKFTTMGFAWSDPRWREGPE